MRYQSDTYQSVEEVLYILLAFTNNYSNIKKNTAVK